jgi:glutamine amidotransferase
MSKVGIINYGMGNLTSVRNAFVAVGSEALILASPTETEMCSHLILPGVGAFGDAMSRLCESGWIDVMHRHAMEKKKPFLGICLGMQLLAERGTEHGPFEGLGWIPGSVTKLDGNGVRIPHIGWNDIEFARTSEIFSTVESGQDFYFVHSYAFRPVDDRCVTSWCFHGERFAASLQIENIFATQFHPEKSQKNGLKLLKNFITC